LITSAGAYLLSEDQEYYIRYFTISVTIIGLIMVSGSILGFWGAYKYNISLLATVCSSSLSNNSKFEKQPLIDYFSV
jgi:hypothetical protein